MITIEFPLGTRIEAAARHLWSKAPAQGEFNGIMLTAESTSVRPADIVAQYERECEARSAAWAASPEGKAQIEADEKARQEAQAQISASLAALPALDFASLDAVLAWVETIMSATNCAGVTYDHERTTSAFAVHGWLPGINCGEAFDGNNADNFARWIVGQWLASRVPVDHFITQWRDRFRATPASPAPSPAP